MKAARSAAVRPTAAPSALDEMVGRAVALHGAGKLPEAEALYRDVLTIDPRHPEALHLLGVIAHQCNQHAAAVELIEQALAVKPREPTFHNNLALALQALRRIDDAARHFKRALALKPDYLGAASNLGLALLLAERIEEATMAAADALAIAQTADTKALFSQCLTMRQDASKIGRVRPMLMRALQERWIKPDIVSTNVCRLAENGPAAKAVKRVTAAWPRRVPAAELDLAAAQSDALLQTLLVSTPVCTPELERYLTQARAALLARALETPEDSRLLPLACALATQCFINEYVFWAEEQESAQLAQLRDRVDAALSAGTPISALQVAALAAYAPLGILPQAQGLLARQWPAPIDDLLTQQVREPAVERELRAAIPRLTPIEDSVSRAVQGQYEDFPYPRWAHTALVRPQTTVFDNAREILVAGCGTGRHPIDIALSHRTARVLAIDLSLSSLAYGVRKARELGADNVDFAQADILELGSLGRSFDHIDSSGVLHHLGDPWTGWRVLLSILRPGGTMRIALYSEIARYPLIAGRAFIAEHGYTGSSEDIRRFRHDTLSRPEFATIVQSKDFYSVSNCRDLLFHVQEQRMTLAQIEAFLTQNDLEFLGFDLHSTSLQRFKDRFAGQDVLTNFRAWEVFERENPSTFTGMYHFDVRRRA